MIKIKKLHENAIPPHYATDGASAFDLHCYEDVTFEKRGGFHYAEVHTGLAFEIPNEQVMKIYPRSGLARNKGITLTNGTGIIDADYRGEVIVLLKSDLNIAPIIKAGTAVAQAIIEEAPKQYFEIVDELSDTVRGSNGFGHTTK